MKLVKFATQDINGHYWEKVGDFGMVAVGRSPADVEVDYTLTDPEQIKYLLATAMVVAARTSPQKVEEAIKLYKEKTNGTKK